MNKRMMLPGLILAALFLCGASDAPSAPAAESTAIPIQPAPAAATAPAPSPKVSAYVNGAKEVGVFKGWPIIIKVSIEHPGNEAEAQASPITLEDPKDWTNLVTAEALDEQKRVHAWKFDKALMTKSSPKLTLDGKNGAFLALLVSPEETGRIEEGKYEVTVKIKGAAPAETSALKVKLIPHPETLPERGEVARDRLLAMYHALKGDKQEAVRIVEKIKYVPVAAQPQASEAQMQPVMMAGPAYVPTAYQPQSSGGEELMSIISSFGFGSELPSVGSIDEIVNIPAPPDTGTPDVVEPTPPGGGSATVPMPCMPGDLNCMGLQPPPVPSPCLPGDANCSGTPPTLPPGPTPTPPGDGGVVVPQPCSPGDLTCGGTPATPPDNSEEYENKPENHVSPDGFAGPDMTMRVEWSGDPVEFFIEDGVTSVGRPITQEGANFQQFRPWDLHLNMDKDFYVAVSLSTDAARDAKSTVKVSYQSAPGQPWQSETVTLDDSKNQNFWVAFHVAAESGSMSWIKRFHTSISSYLNGDPEEQPPAAEEKTDETSSDAQTDAGQSADQPAQSDEAAQ